MSKQVNNEQVELNMSPIAKSVLNFKSIDGQAGLSIRGEETGKFQVVNVLRDRRAGSVIYQRVYDDVVNVEWVAEQMVDEESREACASALIRRPFLQIFQRMVTTPTLKLDGAKLVKTDVIRAVNESVEDPVAARVIIEMIIPTLIGMGLVSATNKFTVRKTYGHHIPRIADLQTDIVRQELEHLLADAKARVDLAAGRTYATKVVADEFNEAFWTVGKRLRQLGDYTTVMNDFVRGVRATIDPALTGLTGEISSDFVNRTEVAILATNFNFIRAALDLRDESIKPSCDNWKLDKWAPIVFALIRNSERYAMVGREEFCGAYDVSIIDDLRGRRRVAVFTEAAQLDPVGMTVIGEPDTDVQSAWNLDEPADKVGARLVATYDKLPAALNTARMAQRLEETLRAVIETDIDTESVGVVVNTLAVDDADYVTQAYAALASGTVSYHLADTGVTLAYTMNTSDRMYEPVCGYRDVDQIVTASPIEAILVGEKSEANMVLSTRPQLIAPTALNTRLLGIDGELDLLPFNQRSTFKFDVLGTSMRGRFEFSDLVSMKNGRYMRIVRPWFNATVTATSMGILNDMERVATAASGINPSVGARLKRDIAAVVVDIAWSIGRGFRQEIHDMMRSRSVATLPPAEAVAMSSRLRQSSFAALADCFALDVFLRRMGLVQDETTSVYGRLLSEPEFATVVAERGSDRVVRG